MHYKFLLISFILLFPHNSFSITTIKPTSTETLIQHIISNNQLLPVVKKNFPIVGNINELIVQLSNREEKIFYIDINGKYYTTLLYDNEGNNYADRHKKHNSLAITNSKQLIQTILNKPHQKTNHSASVITQFFVVVDNIRGFLTLSKNGCPNIYFADRDGKYYTTILFDEHGNSFNDFYQKKYLRFQIMNREKSGIIQQKISYIKHALFIFIDPNDPAGPILYQSLKPYVDKGKFAIKWFFIVSSKKSSLEKADMIYQHAATSPEASLAKNWINYDYKKQEGGINAYPQIPSGAIDVSSKPGKYYKQILSDTQLAKTFTIKKSPILVYQDQKGVTRYLTELPEGAHLKKFIKKLSPKSSCDLYK